MRECMPGRRQGDTRRACRAVRPGLWRAECRRQTAQRCGGLRLQQVHQVLLLSGDVSGGGHHRKEIAAGEDRRQELAYLRTGLFVMHAGVSGDGRRSRPVHLCRAGKAPALGRLRKNNITQYNMKIKQAILHSSSVFDI